MLVVLAVARRLLAAAQTATGLLSDATVLPFRATRFGALTSFTRFDELFGDGLTRNLAASLANNAVGSAQIPSLTPSQTDIQSASALSSFHINIGQLTAAANSRVFSMPFVFEYGLSSRLTLGLSVPVVETRTTLIAQLNPKLGFANVGANPVYGGNSVAARSQNSSLVAALRAAADTLQRRLTACQAAPTSSICSSLNGQQTAAQSLIQTTDMFASSLEKLYGTDLTSHPGDAFVPLASDPSAIAIAAKILSLNTQYQTFVNRSLVSGSMSNAVAPIARDGLQSIVTGFGHDSIQVADRSGIGDISIGATYQLANSYGDTSATAGFRYRMAVNGTFRIGTGQPANRNRFFDNGTGYGQPGIVGGFATDLALNRKFMMTAIGSYTKQLGTIDVDRVPNAADNVYPFGAATTGTYSAGDVLTLTLEPRMRLAGYFSLNGLYSLIHTGADQYTLGTPTTSTLGDAFPPVAPYGIASATAQQIGFGFSYSTIISPDRGPGRIPFEVFFNHLETISASGGPVAKTFRDQVQLRVFVLPLIRPA